MSLHRSGAVRCLIVALLIAAFPVVVFGGFGSRDLILPAVGRVAGAGGSQFYTTVWVTNPSTRSVDVMLEFLRPGQANLTPQSFTDTIAAGATKTYENAAETLFGAVGIVGAVRVRSSAPLLVGSRVYNLPAGGGPGATQGLYAGGLPYEFALRAGLRGVLQGLRYDRDFRYNLFLVESSGEGATVKIVFHDAAGAVVREETRTLLGYEPATLALSSFVGSGVVVDGTAVITVESERGRVLVAGSLVANESQDASGFEMAFPEELLAGSTGPAGPSGPTGPAGPRGVAGPQGPAGAAGAQGGVGPAGPAGSPGPAGPVGPQGATGAVGVAGPAGTTGATGASGATGPTGLQGATGVIGPTGPAGVTGAVGPAGATGAAGSMGVTGATGAVGPAGATGAAGPSGPIGASGAIGPAGATGAIGPAGPTGGIGPVGATGAVGPSGPTGPGAQFAFDQSNVSLPTTLDAETSVLSVTVTTTAGQRVSLDAVVELLVNIASIAPDPALTEARVRLRRNGNVLTTYRVRRKETVVGDVRHVVPLAWTDTPAAGTHTYEIFILPQSGAGVCCVIAQSRSLKAQIYAP